MKIVFLDAGTLADLPEQLARLEKLGTFTAYPETAADGAVDRLRGAQVAIVNKVNLGKDELAKLPDLRLICIAATGMNNVDLQVAESRGIPVRNVAGYSTESVAQLTITNLLTVAMDTIHLNQAVYDATYSRESSFSYWRRPFYELSGKRYGIIGLGFIGHRVAELATAYGAEVVYHSTSGKYTDGPYPHLGLEDLLRTSDAVSIHCPLHPRTRHLISSEELRWMKDSAYLVNVARGGIVDETALVTALNDGQIAGAAFDVYTAEPLPEGHVFLTVQDRSRLLLTPHVAWASVEARTALVDGIIGNIDQGW